MGADLEGRFCCCDAFVAIETGKKLVFALIKEYFSSSIEARSDEKA